MKQGWEIKKLSEICISSNGLWKGKTPPFTTIAVLRSTNFTKDCKIKLDDVAYIEVEEKSFAKRRLQKNDIVVERSGGGPNQPVGRVLLFDIEDENYSFCNFTSALRVLDTTIVSPVYLYRYLTYFYLSGQTINIQSNTIGLRNLDYTKYLEISIPVPPIAEQERIVEILDREFEKIDALKANAERSLQQAKDLFQSALKQELQPQDKWIKSTIGETCILKSGNSNANYSSVGTLPFVKVGDMNIEGNEESITCSSTYVSRDENIKGIFPVGSVIFPKRGGAILTNKKRITTTDICCDLNIMGVYSKGEIISELLYLYFLGVDLSQIYNGAAIPQINNGDIAPLHISFPKDVVEQQYIVAKLNKLRLNCKAVEENYTKTMTLCDDMKQALLRQAFNGEL